MKKLIIFSFLIGAVHLQAQDDKSRQNRKENDVKKEETQSTTLKTASFVEGEIPTPEEQGFKKKVVDGKDVYYKQDGALYIEYQPK